MEAFYKRRLNKSNRANASSPQRRRTCIGHYSCESCKRSKVRCDAEDNKPCKRCQKTGRQCVRYMRDNRETKSVRASILDTEIKFASSWNELAYLCDWCGLPPRSVYCDFLDKIKSIPADRLIDDLPEVLRFLAAYRPQTYSFTQPVITPPPVLTSTGRDHMSKDELQNNLEAIKREAAELLASRVQCLIWCCPYIPFVSPIDGQVFFGA